MRAHLLQTDFPVGGKTAAFGEVRAMAESAGPESGDLIVLPELFACGFTPDAERDAESGDRLEETGEFLSSLAKEFSCTVQGSAIGRAPSGKLRNLAAVFGPDGAELGLYEKIHPFDFGGESAVFGAGEELFLYRWGDVTVCPMICYDLRFPECFRKATALGAHLFALGANWPKGRREHWRALLRARSIENLAYVLGVNCTGSDGRLSYKGESQAYDPQGRPLGELGEEAGVLSVEIELRRVLSWREKSMILRGIRDPERLRVVRA